jgi:hypothetical protein
VTHDRERPLVSDLTGVAANELTTTDWRDPIADTPRHEHIPARLEAVAR